MLELVEMLAQEEAGLTTDRSLDGTSLSLSPFPCLCWPLCLMQRTSPTRIIYVYCLCTHVSYQCLARHHDICIPN